MQLFLIRHGETPLNAKRVFQFPDTPLSERGLAQAQRVAKRLRDEPIDAILVSDHARAMMTAHAIQNAAGAPLTINASLGERDFGDLRGRAHSELDFDAHSRDYDPPNGESWPVFNARVDEAWNAVCEFALQQPRCLVVVSHGLVLTAIVQRHIQPQWRSQFPKQWANTAVTELHHTKDNKECDGGVWQPQLFACHAHLDDDSVADGGQIAGL